MEVLVVQLLSSHIFWQVTLSKGLRLIDLIASIAAVYFIFTNDVLFRWLNNLVTYQVKLVIYVKFEYLRKIKDCKTALNESANYVFQLFIEEVYREALHSWNPEWDHNDYNRNRTEHAVKDSEGWKAVLIDKIFEITRVKIMRWVELVVGSAQASVRTTTSQLDSYQEDLCEFLSSVQIRRDIPEKELVTIG